MHRCIVTKDLVSISRALGSWRLIQNISALPSAHGHRVARKDYIGGPRAYSENSINAISVFT